MLGIRYLLLLPLLYVVASYFAIALQGGSLQSMTESENSYFQLVGALAFLAAACLFVIAYVRSRRPEHRPNHSRLKQAVYLVLAVAFFFAAGEELSWGQHLLGFATPGAIEGVNAQDETTFHNLEFLQGGRGEVNPLYQAFMLFWVVGLVLIPLVALLSARARRLLDRHVPLAPLALGILFPINHVASKIAEAVSAGESHAIVEIKESNFAVLICLAALFIVEVRFASRPRGRTVLDELRRHRSSSDAIA